MVVLNRIYTRTGDRGLTRLATGEPVAKSSPRVQAYGEVDETNACVGLCRLHGKFLDLQRLANRGKFHGGLGRHLPVLFERRLEFLRDVPLLAEMLKFDVALGGRVGHLLFVGGFRGLL